MKRQELIRLMTEKAQSVQTIVANIRSLDEAFKYSAELTQQQGGETLACLGFADMTNLRQVCDMQKIRLLDSPMRNHLNQIHTALTAADWGIAETGTLVADSTSEDMRIATMLAETHVAVIPASKIFPDAMSLQKELSELQKDSPRYLAFISGASRTADIERVMTIGVHGPQALHILILED